MSASAPAYAVAALLPCAVSALAIWLGPSEIAVHLASWTLTLYAAAIIVLGGAFRAHLAARVLRLDPPTIALAAFAPSLAVLGCAAAPWIGFRWVFVAIITALTVQNFLDIGGRAMPAWIRRARPIWVSGGLICLLIGLVGA